MKKIFFAILGTAVLLASCKQESLYLEQNPYRSVNPYTPGTCELTVPGTLTADEHNDWITVSQSGDKATFTLRRNTTGIIRQARFSIKGQPYKAIIFQKAHALDGTLTADVLSQSVGAAVIKASFYTDFLDDYAGWGLAYGKTSDFTKAVMVGQKGLPVLGANVGEITGLEEDTDYFVWAYVVSTEDDIIKSNMIAMISPVYVKAGEDLQAAIDGAKEFSEIRLAGGATFSGGIKIYDSNKNKSISGGWNADFSKKSMDNLTIIDGGNVTDGFFCAANESDEPLKGYIELSYLDIRGCNGDHGSAVHICGGPLTVHHCYIHDNTFLEKGAIGTREEKFSSDMTIYNCKFENNISIDGHGACLGLGDGASTDDPVHATVVNNLFANNRSDTYGGYASIFICYNNTELIFVNNTVVGNFNYAEDDYEYEGMKFRGNTRNLLANNLIVGNLISDNGITPAVERAHPNYIGLGGAPATFANNIIEGVITENGNMTDIGNQYLPAGTDSWKSVLDSNWQPVGAALGAGTFDQFTIKFGDGKTNTAVVKDILDKFNTDLAGKPRVVNGKVDCGCYQSQ